MKSYMKAVKDIRKNLFPDNAQLFWHDSSIEKKLFKLINNLEVLLKEKQEIDEEGQQLLQNIHESLLKEYSDLKKHQEPKDFDPKRLDEYLIKIADLFKNRYKFVNSNRFMKRLYKKIGCEILFGKRIDVIGDKKIKGPAIVVMTHHLGNEQCLLQAIIPYHIYICSQIGEYWFQNLDGTCVYTIGLESGMQQTA
jgi:hypothetical protein